ncbi:hypothetical protein KHQ81_11710 [Mycoplasmatota bacterium]|nr:hypothetical protein KHQ81_11710 [Mycoplasmatota bacterium]
MNLNIIPDPSTYIIKVYPHNNSSTGNYTININNIDLHISKDSWVHMYPDSTVLNTFTTIGEDLVIDPETGSGYYKYSYYDIDGVKIYTAFYQWELETYQEGGKHNTYIGVIFTHSEIYVYDPLKRSINWFAHEIRGKLTDIKLTFNSEQYIQNFSIFDETSSEGIKSNIYDVGIVYAKNYLLSIPMTIVEAAIENGEYTYQSHVFKYQDKYFETNDVNRLKDNNVYSMAFVTGNNQYLKMNKDSVSPSEFIKKRQSHLKMNVVTEYPVLSFDYNISFKLLLEASIIPHDYLQYKFENGKLQHSYH